MLDPYRGKVSALLPVGDEYSRMQEGLCEPRSWRAGFDRYRARAIGELAKHLRAQEIVVAAGPVLSGALFAQALENMAPRRKPKDDNYVRGSWLPKPGYAPEKHSPSHVNPVRSPWVFVDDILCSGRSASRAAEAVASPPEAAIFFGTHGGSCHLWPEKWNDVPVMILYKIC